MVPQAPANLGVTLGGGGRINLGWIDKSTVESGFRIYRKTGHCAATTPWGAVGTVPANTVRFQNSGLVSGTPYAYQVRTYAQSPDQPEALGHSLAGNCVSATAP